MRLHRLATRRGRRTQSKSAEPAFEFRVSQVSTVATKPGTTVWLLEKPESMEVKRLEDRGHTAHRGKCVCVTSTGFCAFLKNAESQRYPNYIIAHLIHWGFKMRVWISAEQVHFEELLCCTLFTLVQHVALLRVGAGKMLNQTENEERAPNCLAPKAPCYCGRICLSEQ